MESSIEKVVWDTSTPVFFIPEFGYKCVQLNLKFCLLHARNDKGEGLRYVGTYDFLEWSITGMLKDQFLIQEHCIDCHHTNIGDCDRA